MSSEEEKTILYAGYLYYQMAENLITLFKEALKKTPFSKDELIEDLKKIKVESLFDETKINTMTQPDLEKFMKETTDKAAVDGFKLNLLRGQMKKSHSKKRSRSRRR